MQNWIIGAIVILALIVVMRRAKGKSCGGCGCGKGSCGSKEGSAGGQN